MEGPVKWDMHCEKSNKNIKQLKTQADVSCKRYIKIGSWGPELI